HDVAVGDRDRRDERDTYLESICGRANAEHIGAQHGKGSVGVWIDGNCRLRQSDSRQAPRDTKPGLRHVHWNRDVYDSGANILAGIAEFADAARRSREDVTQWRTCTHEHRT